MAKKKKKVTPARETIRTIRMGFTDPVGAVPVLAMALARLSFVGVRLVVRLLTKTIRKWL